MVGIAHPTRLPTPDTEKLQLATWVTNLTYDPIGINLGRVRQ
jgi:hypothetical protein